MVSETGSGHRAGGADLASWVDTAGTVAMIDLRLPHHPRLGSPLRRYVRYNRSQAHAHPASAISRLRVGSAGDSARARTRWAGIERSAKSAGEHAQLAPNSTALAFDSARRRAAAACGQRDWSASGAASDVGDLSGAHQRPREKIRSV